MESSQTFSYLDQDGWGTLLLWIDEAKDNPSFLKELIDLLDKLPMTIDRLKSNSIAKIVKVNDLPIFFYCNQRILSRDTLSGMRVYLFPSSFKNNIV